MSKKIRSLLFCAFAHFVLLLALVLVPSTASNAQSQLVASVTHTRHVINSTVLGEERTILVRVPADYERGISRFPAVYMLDAHPPQNAMMAGILEQQTWGGMMPEMILVGIQNTARSRDLTPTDDGKGGRVGGGPKFLQFIETEVIPFVEKNYRTQPYRIFAGHSLGGLFAMYAFVSRPELFNAYIAASPALGYDDNYVIKRTEDTLKQDKKWNKIFFFGLGDEPTYLKSFNALQDVLKRSKPKDLEYEFRQFKDENHGSVVLPTYYAGLRKVFAGWQAPTSGSVAGLQAHYQKLSDRFGYKIPIPETTLNQIGYQLMHANRIAEAIDAFKTNVESYPYSANCYDSLAAGHEKNGDLKLSKENYEKAYKLAEAHGEADLAKSAKANFERISAKSK